MTSTYQVLHNDTESCEMTQVRYSRLNDGGPENNARRSIFQTSKICGVISCLLIVGCVLVAIVIAKLLAENKFLVNIAAIIHASYTSSLTSIFRTVSLYIICS